MKNKIKFIQFVAILFFSFSTYAQVTVSVQNLQYTNNGQSTISPVNCGNIDLASSTSTSINLGINLSKSNGQVVGLSDLRVYTQKSSSDYRVERSWAQIQELSWNHPSSGNDTYSTTASFSINSSDFNISGGTLFVVFKSSGGGEYQTTCSFTITKTPIPTFTLSPTSLNLSCGDTSAKSFTVTPANIPSGATVTYQWNYNGWSGPTTSSSVNLTPDSGTNLPGSVSVTPFINGVANATKTCTVSRSPFNPSFTLTGITQACPGATSSYSINAGTNTVVWSLSTAGIATLNTTTGQNVNLTGIANGSVTLRATVTNACGQSKLFSKQILIGRPIVTNGTVTGGGDNAPINTTRQLTATTVTGATSYVWTVINLSSNCVSANGTPISGVILPKFSNGLSTITTFAPITVVNWGNCPASVVVNCSASNSCGNTGISYKLMNVIGNGGEGDPCPGRMSISPNPVKEDIITVNIADGGDPCGPNPTVNKLAVNNQVKIYDLQGNLLYSNEFKSNTFKIKDLHLKKGHYALNVISSEGYVNKKIIVVE